MSPVPHEHELEQLIRQAQTREKPGVFQGTFRDYYDYVKANPAVVETSYQRLTRAILVHGVDIIDTADNPRLNRLYGRRPRKLKQFRFFKDEFYGIDEVIEEIMSFLISAAQGGEECRQVLYLVGPVATGKSSLVEKCKKALVYSGPFLAIKGCPIQEEPLRAVPDELRRDFEERLGLKTGAIRGYLCPKCKKRLRGFDGDFTRFEVESKNFSIDDEVGIGCLPPADDNSADVGMLIGQIDMGKVGTHEESNPDSLLFNGALNRGERGLVDLVEVNKNPIEVLHPLITVTQEHRYRAPAQHPMIYSDTVLLAHSNEEERDRFRKDRRNEALVDRCVFVDVPYTLEFAQEMRILDKIILREAHFTTRTGEKAHFAPATLELVARFAELSRLAPSKKDVSLMTKLMIYNGNEVIERTDRHKPIDIEELREEAREAGFREGFEGLSTRFGMKMISKALAGTDTGECVCPVDVMETIRKEIPRLPLEDDTKKFLIEDVLRGELRAWYLKDVLREHISVGFLGADEDHGQQICNEYIENVQAYCLQEQVRDRRTSEIHAPDEDRMRMLETKIGVTGDAARQTFRAEIAAFVGKEGQHIADDDPGSKRKYQIILPWNAHSRLEHAIKEMMFDSISEWARLISSGSALNPEEEERVNRMTKNIIAKFQYCHRCVQVVLRFAHNHKLFKSE